MQSNFIDEKESDQIWKTLQHLDNSTKIITTSGTLSLRNEMDGFTCRKHKFSHGLRSLNHRFILNLRLDLSLLLSLSLPRSMYL